jgi:hypothetical protein
MITPPLSLNDLDLYALKLKEGKSRKCCRAIDDILTRVKKELKDGIYDLTTAITNVHDLYKMSRECKPVKKARPSPRRKGPNRKQGRK